MVEAELFQFRYQNQFMNCIIETSLESEKILITAENYYMLATP
jgi:hypothetical protein